MASEPTFDVPRFSLESVREAIQEGILGENVQNITTDQLKNLTPTLMVQICKSFLQKIDFDVDHLLAGGPTEFPEICNSFFSSAVVLAQVTSQLIPGLTHPLVCSNILYPKWSSVRSFLSWTINFCRFWNRYHTLLTDSMTKSEELVASINALQNENVNLERVICDIDVEMEKNSEHYEKQKQALGTLQEVFEQNQRLKEEKFAKKEEVKQTLMETIQKLDSYDVQHQQYLEEEAKIKEGVVSSPGRQLSEHKTLSEKLELAKDDHLKVQDNLSDLERNANNMNQTMDLVQYTLDQTSESMSFLTKVKNQEDAKLKMQCQSQSTMLDLQKSKQEINTLKENISSHRQQLHRFKIRQQKKKGSNDQKLKDHKNEIEVCRDKMKNKDEQITTKLEKLQSLKKDRIQQHEKKMELLQTKENEILSAFAQTEMRITKTLEEHVKNKIFN